MPGIYLSRSEWRYVIRVLRGRAPLPTAGTRAGDYLWDVLDRAARQLEWKIR